MINLHKLYIHFLIWLGADPLSADEPIAIASSLRKFFTVEWRFWFQWVLFSVIGLLLDVWIISELKLELPLFPITAVIQWILLRQKIFFASLWVLATIIGSVLSSLAGIIFIFVTVDASFSYHFTPVFGVTVLGVIFGVLVGALCGAMQWLALFLHVQKSYFWVFASSLGWGTGFGIGFALDKIIWGGVLGSPVTFAIEAIIAMTITGFTLVKLLQYPKSY